jgi:hypothetical protein
VNHNLDKNNLVDVGSFGMIYKRSLNWHLASPKVSGLGSSIIICSNLREFEQVIGRDYL